MGNWYNVKECVKECYSTVCAKSISLIELIIARLARITVSSSARGGEELSHEVCSEKKISLNG